MLHSTWILMGATHVLFPQLPYKKRAALTSPFLIFIIEPAEGTAEEGPALGPRLQPAGINYSDTWQNWKWDVTCFKIEDGCRTKCHQVWNFGEESLLNQMCAHFTQMESALEEIQKSGHVSRPPHCATCYPEFPSLFCAIVAAVRTIAVLDKQALFCK